MLKRAGICQELLYSTFLFLDSNAFLTLGLQIILLAKKNCARMPKKFSFLLMGEEEQLNFQEQQFPGM